MAIDWYRAAPWWRIAAHSVGISWRASHILLCAVALLCTHGLTGLAFRWIQPEGIPAQTDWVHPENDQPVPTPFGLQPPSTSLARGLAKLSATVDSEPRDGLAITTTESGTMGYAIPWHLNLPDSYIGVWRKLVAYPYQALESWTVRRTAYFLFAFAVTLAIWSFVGGCLSRRSIQELGTRITSPWTDTLRLVQRRWLSIVWAIAMPLGLLALAALGPLVLGWLANIPGAGPWIAGILMVPVALLSIGAGWCAAISLFGFPLSTAAIVAEKQADAFDGVSRAAAYTFQRPVTLILCVAVAEWIGYYVGAMVSIVLNTGFAFVAQAFRLGSTRPLTALGTPLDSMFHELVPCLITAFGFSFFWTASSAIYLILRREVDHAEFDLIDMEVVAPPKALPKLPDPPGETKPAASE